MAKAEYVNLNAIDAINVIKQKPVKEIDAEDIAFLRANEELMSDVDKKIYFDGVAPEKAHEDSGAFRSRNDRVIHENRVLQDLNEARGRQPNGAPIAETFAPTLDVDSEKVQKEWKDTISALNKEADKMEVEAKKAETEAEKARKDEEARLAKATPVRIV